jgi:hypothetical protein
MMSKTRKVNICFFLKKSQNRSTHDNQSRQRVATHRIARPLGANTNVAPAKHSFDGLTWRREPLSLMNDRCGDADLSKTHTNKQTIVSYKAILNNAFQ